MNDTPFANSLVLHADDFGMNRVVSDGILRGFREGLLTSTSLMANAPSASQALEEWKVLVGDHAAESIPSMPSRRRLHDPLTPFNLGIHLNLTQGRPLSGDRYPSELLDGQGRFPGVFSLFSCLCRSGRQFQEAIHAELERHVQVVCDHGLQPVHLNGHQYIEMLPVVSEILPRLIERFSIRVVRVPCERSLWRTTLLRGEVLQWPLACVKRAFAERFRTRMHQLGMVKTDVFFGTAHAGRVDLPLLRRFLENARSASMVEVGLHPGEASDDTLQDEANDGWGDPLAKLRPKELDMLTSAELPEMLASMGRRLGRLSQ